MKKTKTINRASVSSNTSKSQKGTSKKKQKISTKDKSYRNLIKKSKTISLQIQEAE
jgi:hypothetical protein